MSTTTFSISYVWEARSFIWALLYRDIKTRYASSLLGTLWLFLEPLFLVLTLALAFSLIDFRAREGVPHIVYFYAGILTFNAFRSALTSGCNTFWEDKTLIRRHPFPKEVLVLKKTMIVFLDFLVASLAFMVILPFYGYFPTIGWLAIPGYLAILATLVSGTIFMVGTLNVFIRDVEKLAGTLAQLLFWATPIVFDFSGSQLGRLLESVNPLAGIMGGIRHIIISGQTPALNLLVVPTLQTIIVFAIGYAVFRKYEKRFIDVL